MPGLPEGTAVSPQHRCPAPRAWGHAGVTRVTAAFPAPRVDNLVAKALGGPDGVGPRQWVPAAAGEGGKLCRLWLNWNEARRRPAVPALGTLTPWAAQGS